MKINLTPFLLFLSAAALAGERQTSAELQRIRDDPPRLRLFLSAMPKGADLHTHLDGAIYAESFIGWAAEDGKCVDVETQRISAPPCDPAAGRPAVSDVFDAADIVNRMIDAFSVRNYERRPVSGHDQFFSTFERFAMASTGREGDMVAEVLVRADQQNIVYVELMQLFGMFPAIELGRSDARYASVDNLAELRSDPRMQRLVAEAVAFTDATEARVQALLGCNAAADAPGCGVTLRYLASVLRGLDRPAVAAQTLLAFLLVEGDPRYVGMNMVMPEDMQSILRNYRWQMQLVARLRELVPAAAERVTLHAGELWMGLVPPEDLRFHVREAVLVAGARRIGHGVAIPFEADAYATLRVMAERGVLVEINLTSNDTILGVAGADHPFGLYRSHGVPLALSTDDEGVSRIDLSREYERAVRTYRLDYADLKTLSRNSLAYSFLDGDGLFEERDYRRHVDACRRDRPGPTTASAGCAAYLAANDKARLQWELERRFAVFEDR